MEPAGSKSRSGTTNLPGGTEDRGTISSPREEEVSDEEDHGVGVVAKRLRVEDEEERELEGLMGFRRFWESAMIPHFGPLTATTGTDIGPMHYTESGPPRSGGINYDALEIFSIKVTKLKGLDWPIRVFGIVAARDSMDHKRNVLFESSEQNCQTLTEKDSLLHLTGPSRAIARIDPPEFEVELRVLGSRPSERKVLSALYFEYTNRYFASKVGNVQTWTESSNRCTIELKYAELIIPLEATIEMRCSEGSVDFQFFMDGFTIIQSTWAKNI